MNLGRYGTLLAFGLAFVACNEPTGTSGSNTVAPDGTTKSQSDMQKEYSESVLRLKKEIKDPVLLSRKVQDLKSEYAFSEPVPNQQEIETAIRGTQEALSSMHGGASQSPDGREPGLAKTASGYTLVKNFSLNVRQTYIGSAWLNPFKTITVTANAIGSADPFLVLFTPVNTGGIYWTHRVLGWNDDGAGGLSSTVSYSLGSASFPMQVYFIVFSANAEAGIGNVNIVVNSNSGANITYINNVPARGVGAVNNNAGTRPCSYANGWDAKIEVTGTSSRFFALDAYYNHATTRSDKTSMSSIIPDYSETGTPNFVVPFVPPGTGEFLGTMTESDFCP